MTEFEKNAPTCAACKGVCCKVGLMISISPSEEIYNDEKYVKQIDSINGFRYMKSKGDGYTCIALGDQGECTIHERRPQVCKNFEVNCQRCKELRRYNERP